MQYSYRRNKLFEDKTDRKGVQVFNVKTEQTVNTLTKTIREVKGKYIPWGDDDRLGEQIADLYNNSPLHASIIKGKANLISGNRFEFDTNKELSWYLDSPNTQQSLEELTYSIAFQISLYGQAYVQFSLINGKPVARKVLNSLQCRVNKENTKVFTSESFALNREIDEFNQFSLIKPSNNMVMVLRENTLNEHYCIPNYITGALDITNDGALQKQINSALNRGFMPKLKIVLNDEPDNEEEAKKIMDNINEQLTGLQADRSNALVVFGESNDVKIEEIQIKNLDEQFEVYQEAVERRILFAHNIPSKALVGLANASSLGNATELRNAYAIYLQSTIRPVRKVIERCYEKDLKLKGIWTKFEIKDDFLENLEEQNRNEI